MHFTITEDYRLRFNGEPLPGDWCTLSNGERGVVTEVKVHDGNYYCFAAPAELVDRNKYLSYEYNSTKGN